MAHRTEKEETTEFKTKLNNPTPPQPSSQPLSLCSSTTTTTCVNPTSTKPKTTSFSSQQITKKRDSSDLDLDSPAPMKKVVNRCFGCKRKIGLTGFKCRCGEMFCGEHRYSDRHDCSFDYKSAGREAIKRENPVVKASKIVRV